MKTEPHHVNKVMKKSTVPGKVKIVRRMLAVWPFTGKVLLPVLDEPGIALVILGRQAEKVIVKSGHWIGHWLHGDGSLNLGFIALEDE